MRVLALRGAHVIGTARTLEKGKEACAQVKGRATPVVLELSDLNSVVACANAIRKLDVRIDMLILNAGIMMREWRTIDGIEQHFFVNHLAHFLLTQRLLDRVIAAEQGRVVVVGSGNHRDAPAGGIQFDDLSGKSWNNYYSAPQSAHQTDAAMAKKLWDVSTELTRKYRA